VICLAMGVSRQGTSLSVASVSVITKVDCCSKTGSSVTKAAASMLGVDASIVSGKLILLHHGQVAAV